MNQTAIEVSEKQYDESRHEGHEAKEHLTFMLSGEEFAVSIMQVREIQEYRDLTTVPLVPGFIRGAINLRGSVVPVIDLAAKFGLSVSEISRRTCIVVIEVNMDGEDTTLGVLVDKVLQVLVIDDEQIESAPSFGSSVRTDYIHGMANIEGNFVVVLDIDRVLSPEEIAVSGDARLNDSGGDNSIAAVTE